MEIKIEIVNNETEIRNAFAESFLLAWKEFKAENNELVKLITGKNYSMSSNMLHLYDLAAVSKESTFDLSLRRLKEKDEEVYFMSESESYPEAESVIINGVSYKGGVFKANSKDLADLIEKEWENAKEEKEIQNILPFDLYVFDGDMKKAIVFTSDMIEYEEDGEITEDRLCLSLKRRRGKRVDE